MNTLSKHWQNMGSKADPGTDFRIAIPPKWFRLFRSRTFDNPAYSSNISEFRRAMATWRRLALFFDESIAWENCQDLQFDEIEPFERLSAVFKMSLGHFTLNDLAKRLSQAVNKLNMKSADSVRIRLQITNEVHAGANSMNFWFGEPNLDFYRGKTHHTTFDDQSRPISLGRFQVTPEGTIRFQRPGEETYWMMSDELPDLHPLAETLGERLWGAHRMSFDRITTGPFGLQAGLLPWNTRAINLGAPLGQLFSAFPDLYRTVKTGVYTDRFGRLTDYYGWVYTSKELCNPTLMLGLLKLLHTRHHAKAQVLAANKTVSDFLEETRLTYRVANKEALTELLFWYLMLRYGEWSRCVLAPLKAFRGATSSSGELLHKVLGRVSKFVYQDETLKEISQTYEKHRTDPILASLAYRPSESS